VSTSQISRDQTGARGTGAEAAEGSRAAGARSVPLTRSGRVRIAELARSTPTGTPGPAQPGCPHAPADSPTAPPAGGPRSTTPHATAHHASAPRSATPRAIAPRATAQHATAQHATAQHPTPQHPTAPHATAQHASAPQAIAPQAIAPHVTAARPGVPRPAAPRPAVPHLRAPDTAGQPGHVSLVQRQISHDIHHELGTIMMLASLVSIAPDVGAESRERARQILGEIRWLDELQRAYEALTVAPEAPALSGPPVPMRLDALAADVVSAMQLSTLTRITITAAETWARTDRLGYWRALRNMIDNALRAAGGSGHVEVSVSTVDGWAVAQVDDDGPGLGQVPPGLSSLGLGIVQDLASARGGQLEIRRGALGGCCVRLLLPADPPGRSGAAL
jgi:hypothetical protein